MRRQLVVLVALDAVAVGVATGVAKVWSFGLESADLHIRSITVPYIALALAIVPTWLAILGLSGAYDVGPFGSVAGEYGRVVRAGANFLTVVAVAYFVLHLEKLARGFLVVMIPLAVVLTLGLRAAARVHTDRARARGQVVRRAVVVGSRRSVADIVRHLGRHPGSGLATVGACVPGPVEPTLVAGGRVPVLGGTGTDAVLGALERSGADTVILTGSLALGRVRTLAWQLEGSGVDLFVLPSMAEGAAHLDVRPVAGLPLVFVDQVSDLPVRRRAADEHRTGPLPVTTAPPPPPPPAPVLAPGRASGLASSGARTPGPARQRGSGLER
jgi:FlaA1/EpsC-like NDP-sugar epimerase